MACYFFKRGKVEDENTKFNNADDPKVAFKANWTSITRQQEYRQIVSMLCCINAVK